MCIEHMATVAHRCAVSTGQNGFSIVGFTRNFGTVQGHKVRTKQCGAGAAAGVERGPGRACPSAVCRGSDSNFHSSGRLNIRNGPGFQSKKTGGPRASGAAARVPRTRAAGSFQRALRVRGRARARYTPWGYRIGAVVCDAVGGITDGQVDLLALLALLTLLTC